MLRRHCSDRRGGSWEGMSLHGLGGPSKHNAAEEFWRQRLAKEAKAAEAKATSDSRVSSGFAPAQRSACAAGIASVRVRVREWLGFDNLLGSGKGRNKQR